MTARPLDLFSPLRSWRFRLSPLLPPFAPPSRNEAGSQRGRGDSVVKAVAPTLRRYRQYVAASRAIFGD